MITISCDGGLEPLASDQKSFLEVKLNFVNGKDNWPPKDSLYAIRVAAFKKFPDSSIINDIVAGNAYFTFETLPLEVDTSSANFEISPTPVNLVYIAAVQQYDSLITSQRVIGIYTITGDNTKYSNLQIERGKKYSVNINIDFDNLPPMPF